MPSSLQHAECLLLTPEPKEEQRRQDLPLLFVFVGGFNLVVGAYDYAVDGFVNNFSLPILGVFFLLNALLYALPEHRHRAMLGVRAVLSLTILAFAASLSLTLGAVFALLFLVAWFCINYFVNRRRSRGEQRPAA